MGCFAAIYTIGCVWLLWRFGVWGPRNSKTVAFWFVGTAIVSMMNLSAIERGAATLMHIAKAAFAVSAAIAFLSGINTLSFWLEFLLLPILVLIGLMAVVAERDRKHKPVGTFLVGCLSLVGVTLLGFSLFQIYADWGRFDAIHQAREFAVPIALTLLFLPFLYLFMIAVAFDSAAASLPFVVDDRVLRRYVWIRGVLAFGLHLDLFKRYMQAIKTADRLDRDKVKQVVAELKRIRKREKRPPKVNWADGWSPYEASEFLADHGLRTGPYHRSFGEWWAETQMRDIDSGPTPNRVAYQLAGTEIAATRLSLVLYVNNPEMGREADDCFYRLASILVDEALGNEMAYRFMAVVRDEPITLMAGDNRVELARDDWSIGVTHGYERRVTLLHSAHRAAVFGG